MQPHNLTVLVLCGLQQMTICFPVNKTGLMPCYSHNNALPGETECPLKHMDIEAYRDMRSVTTGILVRSEKCVVRRFRRCANFMECTYKNLDSIANYTPSLYGIDYCS